MIRFSPAFLIGALIVAPAPPGSVVQRQAAHLSAHGQWRAVITKQTVGTGESETFYQWHLGIYQIVGTTSHQRYESPRDGGPLDKLEKAKGANVWFPRQSASIIGAAPLMGEGEEQLIVQSHQSGADCGSADLTVFRVDAKGDKIVPAVTVQNGCDLNAKIVKDGSGASLQLSGPYYNATAPMCCPTKPKATAMLKYANGKWIETPNYYKYYPNSFPHV